MQFTKSDINALARVKRLKIINAVSGIKSANLIGTINNIGQTNVAIISSVVHLGSDPALIGFIMRPISEVPRHTYNNIVENGYYTINHIHPQFIKNAHYTSAKFDEAISEFDACKLTEEYLAEFKAPFVLESRFKIGMRFVEAIDIKINNTKLIIGEIEHLTIPDEALMVDEINLESIESVGISGLNSYYSLKKLATYPYARKNEVPHF